ncbi:flagellar basal-body rod protein FlgG [Chromatiales bacterium (ex Bugula neritina AB1)]|nr:flagellar basal-body rod protein FlgG [Chromatiales bacterium (ex Bugula neritina AB1)]
MNSALWAAKTGMDAQQSRMAVISNNLANVNTSGFKRDRAIFEDLLYQTIRQPGANSSQDSILPTGLNIGTGVRLVATQKLHGQGSLQITENPMDVAIEGSGFFEIQMPDGGSAYTRDGSFQVSVEGQLVNSSGYALQAGINVPTNVQGFTIGKDGTVSATEEGGTTSTVLGTIPLVSFSNPSGLQAVGGNMFRATASSGAGQAGTAGSDGLGRLVQGSVETSNVNIVEELVSMIETQRAYEINSKAISTTDSMLQFANNNM